MKDYNSNYNSELESYQPKGYIDGNYHFFYLEDKKELSFDYHFHTFHKCLIILAGEVNYFVEGRHYDLKAGDIIWVPSYEAHKVVVSEKKVYKRLVIYLSVELIRQLSTMNTPLEKCILQMGRQFPNYINIDQTLRESMKKMEKEIIVQLKSLNSKEFGSESGNISIFIAWMTMYFKELIKEHNKISKEYISDGLIREAVMYIRQSITAELRVEEIAQKVFLSKYHFMRRFKEVMEISVHQFIILERLTLSRDLMKQGMPLTKIAYLVGFVDYSTFARAFKKNYNLSPRQFKSLLPSLELE